MRTHNADKLALLEAGVALVYDWCHANHVEAPVIEARPIPRRIRACAYYRRGEIVIDIARCSARGYAGRSWSWPGYTVDRTPYGVLAHELGHHVDDLPFSMIVIPPSLVLEPAISGYAPDKDEWFAEMFKVFVTNPTLLQALRPAVYTRLRAYYPVLIETRHWRKILPERQRRAVENKLKREQRREVA